MFLSVSACARDIHVVRVCVTQINRMCMLMCACVLYM